MFSVWREWGRSALDFIYPPHCILCQQPLQDAAERLCMACWQQVDIEAPVRCQRCSKPLLNPASRCANCLSWEPLFERALVLGDFVGALQQAVLALKFGGQPQLGVALGHLLGQRREFAAVWQEIDALVPVPLHPARQRERGYNQSLHIARGIAQSTSLPLVEDALLRSGHTAQQARLPLERRRANVEGRFAARRLDVLPARIGVVDDVITTGETLNACCRALEQAGAQRVWALALACPYR